MMKGQTWRGRLKDRAFHKFYNRYVLNSFGLTQQAVPEYLQQLNRYRPEVIVAYTNPLYTFAKALEEKRLAPYSPKSIVVGAEKLYPFQRELIERVFRAPVFETYGAREFMLIGAECDRHSGLHLTTEHLVVEILDDQGRPTPAGQEGNVVVTDLYNYAMPFVRYVNGDRAIAGFKECSCGRGLPLLSQVTGRTLDVIDTPDGRHVGGEFFVYKLMTRTNIDRFQVVQVEPDRLEVRLVLRPEWSKEEEESLLSDLQAVIGPSMSIEIKPVTDIPLTVAGKLKVVVKLKPDAKNDVAMAHAGR
jgi:phenylacetate-CoA ligase